MDVPPGQEMYMVQQQVEPLEVFTGFECRNKYVVTNAQGQQVFFAAEEGGSNLGRIFLQSLRSFTIRILGNDGQPQFRVERPFKFYFHKADIFDRDSNLLGSVQRKFTLFRRKYDVFDASGNLALELFGPILHPWTFFIRRDGQEIGKITKKWSGLVKEAFTKADNFGVSFPSDLEWALKGVLLGAVFLIDFVHFEKGGRSGVSIGFGG